VYSWTVHEYIMPASRSGQKEFLLIIIYKFKLNERSRTQTFDKMFTKFATSTAISAFVDSKRTHAKMLRIDTDGIMATMIDCQVLIVPLAVS